MTTTARNKNQFEFNLCNLLGQHNPVTKTKTNTKILQFHPGQAICRYKVCKVSSNGRIDGPEHKECTVYATCCSYMSPIAFRPFRKFHVRSRAVTVQKRAKKVCCTCKVVNLLLFCSSNLYFFIGRSFLLGVLIAVAVIARLSYE